MKYAIISDIHGNLTALEAAVKDARSNGVEAFIFAGDYIFDLPYPNQVTELIRGLNAPAVVKGNKEGYISNLAKEDQTKWDIEQFGSLHQSFRELTAENRAYLTGLKEHCLLELPFGKKAYVTHFIRGWADGVRRLACSSVLYRQKLQEQPFTRQEFLEQVQLFLKQKWTRDGIRHIDADVIIFGHSHLQWHGECDGKLLINPGACGTSLDGDNRAAYSILESTASGLRVMERRVEYDIETTIKDLKQSRLYEKGKIWSDLVIYFLETGLDPLGDFFDTANRLAAEAGESGSSISNKTWRRTADLMLYGRDKN